MSRQAYDLLRQAGLINSENKPVDLSAIDETNLRQKLDFYYTSRASAAEAEVVAEQVAVGEFGALRSSISCGASVEDVLPSALVYHRFYVDDPLFRLAESRDENSQVYNQYLGLEVGRPIDRERVASSLAFFAQMAPLVDGRFCSILPVRLLHKGPSEIPIFYSPDGFRSLVPEDVREFVQSSARIREVMPLPGGGLAICPDPPSEPTRGIQVVFQGDRVIGPSMMQLLFEARVIEELGDGKVRIQQSLEWENKPDRAYFDAWVAQSINRAVINRLASISSELHLADGLNACYVTESDFEAGLLGLDAKDGLRGMRSNAVNFLTANAPFFGPASPDAVVALRQDSPALFEKFQASLLHVSGQLIGVEGDYEAKARGLYIKEIEPQIRDIRAQLSKVKWQGASGGIMAAASLSLALTKAAAIPFSMPLAAAFAAAFVFQGVGNVLPSLGEYRQKRLGPAFIWSKLAKQ